MSKFILINEEKFEPLYNHPKRILPVDGLVYGPPGVKTLRKKFHSVKINTDHDSDELLLWCDENLNGYMVYWNEDEIFLTDKRDVFLTKLTWG